MCIDENMNIYTSIEIVHICYIQNWYDTMTWSASNIAAICIFQILLKTSAAYVRRSGFSTDCFMAVKLKLIMHLFYINWTTCLST